MSVIIAPSVLSADFANLQRDIEMINNSEADWFHVDVMDGVFVPNISFGFPVISAVGMQAGVAINPHTPVSSLIDVIADIDLICMMSVNPGFGGQKFIERTYAKISELKEMILKSNSKAKIEIDGGVDLKNASALMKAGADVFVAGNTVFSSKDPVETIRVLKATTV